jgi:uncharacterized protein (TIGR03492 family)
MKDLLFASNGHGEDVIAGRVLDRLRARRPQLSVEAWPMVGEGAAYTERGIATVGARNRLPSAGFATLDPALMARDLKAGWIGTYWRQAADARRMRGRYRMIVAVGDIVPIGAGVLARTPFVFIGCAKSAYYGPRHGYTGLEKRLLRRHCVEAYPRDALTAAELARAGVACRYLGNPMMDGLEGAGDRLGIGGGETVIGLLAGTRADAETNMLDLIAAAGAAPRHIPDPARLRFVFAARPEFDPQAFAADRRLAGWRVAFAGARDGEGVVMRLEHPAGMRALVAKGRFADVLRLSRVVVGMAGTANEQAIGLGIPLVAVPSSGVQGERYVRMKMEYFGEAAVLAPREPDAIASAVAGLLADPARCARMAAAGRERMGQPGASDAIAAAILERFDALAAREAA